jgi:alkyl hydroperoxide reductase subunit AhpC
VIPPFNITTTGIGITFEFAKIRRNHISCIVCSNSEEYSTVCSACITKIVDMEGKVKVVAGNPDKINKELSESFKNFNALRSQL